LPNRSVAPVLGLTDLGDDSRLPLAVLLATFVVGVSCGLPLLMLLRRNGPHRRQPAR